MGLLRIGTLLVILVATAATADDPSRCQRAAAQVGRQLMAVDLAALRTCAQSVAAGVLPAATDCRTDTATRTRRDQAAARAVTRLGNACRDADVAGLVPAGECDAARDVAGLSACLRAAHGNASDRLFAIAGASGALPAAAQACAARALSETSAYALARLRILQRCKLSDQRLALAPGAMCSSAPEVARWLALRRALGVQRLTADCPPAALALLPLAPPCDRAADASQLAACLLDSAAVPATDDALLAELGDPGFCGDGGAAVEQRIDALLAQMTVEEKIAQMHGAPGPLSHTPPLPRLNIPGIVMIDGPRGVGASAGAATVFPVAMARAATWDPELEQRVGEAMGAELRAKGGSMLLAPTMNNLRHPRWGRAQETYGEDTYLLGRMAVGFIGGVQQHVLANAKHFALNSIENTRFNVDVTVDERTLREVYLPHFRAAVQQGHVAAVMSAYNKVNGHYCAENPHLLGDILKGDWHFPGFVESDWVLGTRSTLPSLQAGLDIEMPAGAFYGAPLLTAVNNGQAPMDLIDAAVRRSLRAQLCFRLDSDPPVVDATQVGTPAHLALARQVAREAITLLKNGSPVTGAPLLLPFDHSLASVVVIGPLAAIGNTGDVGSSTVAPSQPPVSPLDGLRALLGDATVTYLANGPTTPSETAAVMNAGAVIVVAGLDYRDEGEGLIAHGDRADLLMPRGQDDLIRARSP
jgi:beta-glucosidase-like glycosyl hydrolase